MKIGIDARLINETGVGRYIRNLLEQLGKWDTENTYIIFLTPDEYHTFTLPNTRWEKRSINIRWHSLAEQLILPWHYYREKLDVLHVPYFTVPILYIGSVIVTIHDLTILHTKTGKATTLPYPLYLLKHIGYQITLKLAVFKARKIISVSQTTKYELIRYLSVAKEKITVIYEGIDTIFQENITDTSPLAYPYFLYVGNVYPHKQADFLLACFKKLMVQNEAFIIKNQIKLLFVGKKDFFYSRLEKEVETSGLTDIVLFQYNTDDPTLARLYRHATALLFPSSMEGFGLPPLEALACNCPVIAMDIPIFKELLSSYAVLLPRNSEMWMNEIERVYNHGHGKNKKTNLDTYLKQFSWEKMAKETLVQYENSTRIR